jgi:membrane protein DedA with SNARE-associated domain
VSQSKKVKRTPAIIKGPQRKKTKKISADPVIPVKKKEDGWVINSLRAVSFLAVIGITVFVYSLRDHIKEFSAFGYPGIFLIALLANATVLVPAPGIAVVFAMGSLFNPLGVGLAAGTGGAIGELSGYLAGFSGQAVVERTDIFDKFNPWIQKYGGWSILVLSAIPNPFFDIAGIAAGISKMPLWRFLLFCWIGQIIKMTMFAYAGTYSINWLINFIS